MLNKGDHTNTQNGALPNVVAGDFVREVIDSQMPVLVEFWSPWSRLCQVSNSVIEELAREFAGKFKVVKINADDNLDLSLGYEIRFVPTLLYFIGGKPRERIVGTASKEAVLARLKAISEGAW